MLISLRTSDAGSASETSVPLSLPDTSSVRDAVRQAALPESEIDLIAVNGVIASLDTELHEKDELDLRFYQATEAPLPPELSGRGRSGYVEELLRAGRRGLDRLLEYVPARLNLSWVTAQLAVGGAYPTSDIKALGRLGITGVVDCRAEDSDDEQALRARGIDFLRLPTPDCHDLTQEALDRGVSWVTERLARREKVFVHCQHGVGRGPLLGCCVLVTQGLSPWDALTTIKARRWQASPNEEQLAALLEFAARHSGATADAARFPAAIANAPLAADENDREVSVPPLPAGERPAERSGAG
jgi:predicted protein tyrosine phosphatase